MNPAFDWNEIWKNMVESQSRNAFNTDCGNMWKRKENAKRFWEMSVKNRDRIEKTISEMPYTSESRILDIGAGPGSLSIPLAQKAAHVTVVEPAEGMMEVLKENLETYSIQNIACVYKDWESVEINSDLCPPYDLVFASYSLGMKDIRASIEKMIQVSSGYIYLYWFAGETPWEVHSKKLWPSLHGCEYSQGPKVNVLYNVLYNMGIYPNMQVFPFEHENRFRTFEEAVEYFKPQYSVSSQDQEEILKSYLYGILKKENGTFVQRGWSIRVKLWWKVS